jgi:hypothetical protein
VSDLDAGAAAVERLDNDQAGVDHPADQAPDLASLARDRCDCADEPAARVRAGAAGGGARRYGRGARALRGAGLVVPAGAPPPIATLLADPKAAAIAARLAENARPHGDTRRAFALPTGDKLFEDAVWDPAAKVFYVSSVRDRRVYAVTTTGELRPLTEPEAAGMGVSGLALDGERHVLWLSTAALPPVPGYQAGDDDAKPSGLVAVDPASGRVVRRLALVPDGAKHALTDLAVTPRGDVLASDATAGRSSRRACVIDQRTIAEDGPPKQVVDEPETKVPREYFARKRSESAWRGGRARRRGRDHPGRR